MYEKQQLVSLKIKIKKRVKFNLRVFLLIINILFQEG